MKRGRPVLAAVAALLALAGPAEAALDERPCGRVKRCATLDVPLDRSGGLRAEVGLAVERVPARRGPRRGVTLLLAGGPGQAALSSVSLGQWRRYTPRNDIVSFDQRGTGASGLLRCRDLESASSLDSTREAEACAVLLGRRRGFYRTSDSVADIEALRVALRAPRLTLVGVSYGTYVAQAYAAAHPARVDRMVLDSVIDVTGVDPLYRDTLKAVPRVLERLCRPGCRRFTRDPVGDVGRLVGRLAVAPARGYVVGQSGSRRRAVLDRQDLLFALIAGDLDPLSRSEFPAAVSSALRGDFAPVLRLRRRAVGSGGGGDAQLFSPAVLAATACEEIAFPWSRFGLVDARPAQAAAAAAALAPAELAPFDAATAAGNDLIRLCRRWPAASPAPAAPLAPPDVPVLMLAGEDDLRTPVEDATAAAARYPRAELVVVPGAGHSVLAGSISSCPQRALDRFLAGREVPPCRRTAREFPVTRPLPLSLREVEPFAGLRGRPGRLAGALEVTLTDSSNELLTNLDALFGGGEVVIPGLRGGRLVYRINIAKLSLAIVLERLEVVPGVRISGRISQTGEDEVRGKLRFRGAPGVSGLLKVTEDRLTGRLAGRRVSFGAPDETTDSAGSAAALARAANSPLLRDVPRLRVPRG